MHKPRVLSGFLRKMSEDQLLIPEECITMTSIIGQGLYIHHVLITDTHQMFQTAGEFGVVFRGSLSNWKDVHNLVAVKTLKGENFIHTSSICQWRLLIV